MILNQNISAKGADIIISTCHAAKGMEWDNVQVCDDFFDLCALKDIPKHGFKFPVNTATMRFIPASSAKQHAGKQWIFDIPNWGDDVNLLYVACTRAKEVLRIPPKLFSMLEQFETIREGQKNSAEEVCFDRRTAQNQKLSADDVKGVCTDIINPLRKRVALMNEETSLVEWLASDVPLLDHVVTPTKKGLPHEIRAPAASTIE